MNDYCNTITDNVYKVQVLIFEVILPRFDDLTKISKRKGRNVRLEKTI